ncbi:MAG: 4-hydroxy-tetrahydrodipicolinate synthase [bacterium]|nr:4-hydroxy-tetrahydrodipicolinate synthase [bacterium]
MSKSPQKHFSGVFTAIITPFNSDGGLDLPAFTTLIKSQLESNVDGLVVCGSTGEAMTLSDEERFTLVSHAVKQVKGKISVIAGAGHCDTKVACVMQNKMLDLGVDATLQVVPWYNKPTAEGLYQHFSAIAAVNKLPIILYNIPSRTGSDIAADTVLKLVKNFVNIVGLKESNVDTVRLQLLLGALKKIRPDFSVFSGEDGFVLPLLAMGGQGVIAVSSNLVPELFTDMIADFNDGKLEQAQNSAEKIAQLSKLMFFRSNPIPVKSALFARGLVQNVFRLPLCPLDEADMNFLRTELNNMGCL